MDTAGGLTPPGAPRRPDVVAFAQSPMLTAHKPGIIALRPLGLGDIYDGAVKVIRGNPRATVGLSALVGVATLLPAALLSAGVLYTLGQTRVSSESTLLRTLLPLIVVPVVAQLAAVALAGLLSHVVSEAVLGRKASVGDTWRTARGRLLPLLAATFAVGFLAAVVPTLLLGAGIAGVAGHRALLAAIGIVLGVLVGVVVMVPAGVLTALLGPVIVLERQGPVQGVRRAIALMRGGFWRLLGILLLTSLVAGVAAYVLRLPFSLLGAVGAGLFGAASPGSGGSGTVLSLSVLVGTLSSLLSTALVTPFTAAVSCLLYVDRRMRVEALDVQLLRYVVEGPTQQAAP